jgi:opacity protein-like surface antigen
VRLCVSIAAAAITVLFVGLRPQPSIANNAPSVEQFQQAMAALEARVAALEARLQRFEGNAEHLAESGQSPLMVSLAGGQPTYNPMQLAGKPQPIQEQLSTSGWGGLYWGTAFGYGSAFSKSGYRSVSQDHDESNSVDSTTDFEDDGSIETSVDTFTDISDGTDIVKGLTEAGENQGALADLYLGASVHLTPRIIAGLQVEGSLAQMVFRSRVRGEDVNYQRTRTSTSQFTNSDGNISQDTDTTQEIGTETNRFPGINEVELDWMVSVIGRAGVLATPTTYLYGLAGWSYGHFEVNDLMFAFGQLNDFESDGLTVGGGIEKMLSPKWSLRAEYRYTDFGRATFSNRSRTAFSDSETQVEQGSDFNSFEDESSSSTSTGTDVSESTSSETTSSKGSFDNNMHLGRIGITRYFMTGH